MKQQLRILILLILVLSTLSSFAVLNELITSGLNLKVELDSFQGGEYFPENDEMNYQQKTDFRFGTEFNLSDQCNIGLKFRYSHDVFEEMIKLDSLSVNLHSRNAIFSFQVYDKKYGDKSYFQNLDASTGYYKMGIIENYRFVGLSGSYNYQITQDAYLSTYATIGGNDYNRTLSMFDLGFHMKNLELTLGTLYFARSNRNNQPGYLGYTELDWGKNWYDIYALASFEHFDNMGFDPITDRVKIYGEMMLHPASYISLGAGYKYEEEDCEKDQHDQKVKSLYLFAEPKFKKFTNSVLLDLTETDNYNYKKYQNILSYSLTSFWELGLSATYIETKPGTENYQFGFQVEVDYEAHSD